MVLFCFLCMSKNAKRKKNLLILKANNGTYIDLRLVA